MCFGAQGTARTSRATGCTVTGRPMRALERRSEDDPVTMSLDRLGRAAEGPLGARARGHADAEGPLRVLGGEVEVVPTVLERGVRRPHLLRGPGDVPHVERDRMYGDGAADAVHGE